MVLHLLEGGTYLRPGAYQRKYRNSVFAEEFIIFFVDGGPTLASKIPVTSKHHSQYINAATSSLEQTEISEEEFKTAYFSLKRNKSLGYDEFRANVGRSVYNEIQKPFFYISQQSFNEDGFL